jgi:cysteinyl-tRNA synthetase
MNLDEFRREMLAYREAVDREAEALKDSYHALEQLRALYRKFDTGERAMADQVLTEWLQSEDESVRFDAQALIDDFKIRSALPALKKLVVRLASNNAVGALHELQLVNRIIADLPPAETSNSKS